MSSLTCGNCGLRLAPAEDGHRHNPETFTLDCEGPTPADPDDLAGFLRARLVEQLRNGNWLGADGTGTTARRETGFDLIRDALAKLQIVGKHRLIRRPSTGSGGGTVKDCQMCDHFPAQYPCATLRLLAEPYAGHPKYREEWRP